MEFRDQQEHEEQTNLRRAEAARFAQAALGGPGCNQEGPAGAANQQAFRVQVGPAPAPPALPQPKRTTGFCCAVDVPLNPFPARR